MNNRTTSPNRIPTRREIVLVLSVTLATAIMVISVFGQQITGKLASLLHRSSSAPATGLVDSDTQSHHQNDL